MKYLSILLILISVSIYSNNNFTAKEIIDKSLEHKTFSYDNAEANITMILIDKNKKKV